MVWCLTPKFQGIRAKTSERGVLNSEKIGVALQIDGLDSHRFSRKSTIQLLEKAPFYMASPCFFPGEISELCRWGRRTGDDLGIMQMALALPRSLRRKSEVIFSMISIVT